MAEVTPKSTSSLRRPIVKMRYDPSADTEYIQPGSTVS